jgi:hypothetical protein
VAFLISPQFISEEGRLTAFRVVFKTAMESPNFLIGEYPPLVKYRCYESKWKSPYSISQAGSDHDRFRFAKAAISRRKQFAGRGAEESVVLAVGEGKGNVHISRKTRRKALWKVAK